MQFTFEVLNNIRPFFKKHIENNSLEDLNKIPEGFNNNIIWNIGHVMVTAQLLAYKLSGLPMNVSDELVNKYRKDSKPEAAVSQAEVDEIEALLVSTLKDLELDYKNGVFKEYNTYTVSTTGNTLTNIDDALQFILLHESMHLGYILALIRAVKN
ncbi:DinB family protein [Algibacter amylolyticus]|uniref:DinB family protein n=1 Tax=Algibacter amylolyticus TaxID=1608400 RepID=A0A5M7BC21_9FLAO|nr:DinB family protein [Algibacter amylolyticus]KAA5827293.1 DinB family protein [Algibacter amylolyticus]MBB5266475.1 putative damage-inducible protein DinB [Algibacter amylolyticus]TSJ81538.1 DinB family protein [Algibacter amylolyticus]